MIPEEACWLRRILEERRPARILDCGSSSVVYRSSTQPHIAALFAGFLVTHLDVQAGPGVDLVRDICGTDELPRYPLVTCASLLEHVADIEAALVNICRAAEEDLLLTVPNRWPLHGGYDNGYRPTLGELALAVERQGLCVREAALIDASGPYAGRRIGAVHALREAVP